MNDMQKAVLTLIEGNIENEKFVKAVMELIEDNYDVKGLMADLKPDEVLALVDDGDMVDYFHDYTNLIVTDQRGNKVNGGF